MGSCDDSSESCDFSKPFDLCIIGSGAAGITIAHKLRNSNRRICVLESSTFNEPQRASLELVQKHETTSSPTARAELDANLGAGWNPDNHRFEDPIAQKLYEGELTKPMLDIDERFLRRSRIRVFGGTTNCWGGWTRPLSSLDFDRSDMDPAWKWPFDRNVLLPFYQEALQYCALTRPDFPIAPDDYEKPELWPSRTDEKAKPLLPPKTPNVRTGIFTAMNGDSSGGVTNGALDFQCVYGPALKAAGVCVERNVNVRGFEVSGSTVTAVNAQRIDRSGPEPRPGEKLTIQAKQFVLAVGGIEGPRLLLMANDCRGLGNRYGHLGRYFMIHPVIENAWSFRGPEVPAEIRAFYRNWPAMRMKGTLPPSFWATFVPTDDVMKQRHIGNFRMIVDFREGGGGKFNLNWEQFPNKDSTVGLSQGEPDLFGDPKVKLDWQLLGDDLRTRDEAVSLVMSELKAWGYLHEDYGPYGAMIPGDHHMGATKMSIQPQDGYVNPDCRLHEIDNLYIASSSVMPTGGVANVTLTIIALALKLAKHLAGR